MNLPRLEALATRWRHEATVFRHRGQESLARMADSFAADLEEALREWLTEPLTLADAADESGYSYDHLQHAVSDGSLPNAGAGGSPRIRRCDLPRKARQPEPCFAEGDLADTALARR